MEPDCYYVGASCRNDLAGSFSCGQSASVTGGAEALRRMAGFTNRDLLSFFARRGVYCHERDGYWYPRTDQAATVAALFERELRSAGVELHLNEAVREMERRGNGSFYQIVTEKGRYVADAVILATGGTVSKAFGCLGDGYRLAARLGHTVRAPHPALTFLRCGDPLLKRAAGVRCDAAVTLRAGGRALRTERGELQITEQGLSGIPVFQLSRLATERLDAKCAAIEAPVEVFIEIEIDFLPEWRENAAAENGAANRHISRRGAKGNGGKLGGKNGLATDADSHGAWQRECARRMAQTENVTLDLFFLGLVHRKALDYLLAREGLCAENKSGKLLAEEAGRAKLRRVLERMRCLRLPVGGAISGDGEAGRRASAAHGNVSAGSGQAARGRVFEGSALSAYSAASFEKAQVTAGGVPLAEVDDTFQSRKSPNLYLTGELLDVDGICGGYNLQWAFSGGAIAGRAAAEK